MDTINWTKTAAATSANVPSATGLARIKIGFLYWLDRLIGECDDDEEKQMYQNARTGVDRASSMDEIRSALTQDDLFFDMEGEVMFRIMYYAAGEAKNA